MGSGCLKGGWGGAERGGRKLHINKPDDPTARSPQYGARGLSESPGSASGALARGSQALLLLPLLFFTA